MDDELRRRARAARAEVEAQVDIESELIARPPTWGAATVTPLPPRRRLVAITGSIAAVAIAIVGGLVLLRGSDSIETTEPSEPITPVATSTSTLGPTPAPATTLAGPTATVVPVTVTTVPDDTTVGGATSTSTTSPGPTTTDVTTAPTTTPQVAVPWRTLPSEATRVERRCSADQGCTEILIDRDGSTVSFDPTSRTLTRHTTPAVTATVDAELGLVHLELLGPDHVVYLNVDAATPGDGDADLLAMTLAPGDAGRVLGRWAGITDRVGDQDLVATRDGLVVVGCCDHAVLRPAPDAEVVLRWVGRDGGDASISGPIMRTEVDAPRLTVHRDDDLPASTRSWTLEPPADWQPRGMPAVIPTFDGGFIANTYDGADQTVIRGWVDGSVDTVTIDTSPDFNWLIIDPNGRVTIADGDRFARFELFTDRSEFWAGRRGFGEGGSIALPDIDTAIDGGAAWARDPVAFGNAVAGQVAVNERRTIDHDRSSESEFRVTVTTSNHFDDSVFATRLELNLTRDADGRFRFVSGRASSACQPGRGQQDFSPDLCI